MAIVKAPLLSLGATGKIAGTIVFATWKGLKTAREFVIPSNPKTAGQVTQRTLFSDMVESWRTYFTDSDMRTAWNLSASVGSKIQSGFNAAMSAMLQIAAGDPDASFAVQSDEVGAAVAFDMANVDDGAAGDESGDFEAWLGLTPSSLLFDANDTIIDNSVNVNHTFSVGTVFYAQIRKDGQDRSGIVKHTATSA